VSVKEVHKPFLLSQRPS